MDFRSDNVVPAAPAILEAVLDANRDSVTSYAADPYTARAEAALKALFERDDLFMLPVVSGTATNALALATYAPTYGAVYCHEEAHIRLEEAGAPGFYTGGAVLVPLAGPNGKFSAAVLAEALSHAKAGGVHWSKPALVSVTQVTEAGTLYALDEVRAIADVARKASLIVHMDGARFANAVAALGCTPADASWKLGVDVLSFGATKGGALAAEAVILFGADAAARERLRYLHKRAGLLLSKMRFVSAQLEAFVADGLWLALARHANAMAARLSQGLAARPGVRLAFPTEANEVFAHIPDAGLKALEAGGAKFLRIGAADSTLARFVCSHATRAAEVDAFLALALARLG
ncbi:MAG: low specificity L-threonine aldolase [Alphaproteobacteria bacterium]|nr:low specificity L-threonine aldolase [Alphaproteobacteria bacterium]